MKLVPLLVISLLLGATNVVSPIKKESQQQYEKHFIADFSSLPAAFTKYDKSDATNSNISVEDGTLKIEHATNTTVGNQNYYGALYNIAAFDDSIGNFEMSMTFKMTSFLNNSRWVGLVYHTKMNEANMLSGYMFGVRANGVNWHAEINNTPAYSDTLVNDSGTILPQDYQYHTMKVVCHGDDITYSLDEKVLINLKISEYSSTLTNAQYSGGFGLVLNKCSIQISDFRISGNVGDSMEYKDVDETLADTYSPSASSKINTDVAVNKWARSREDITYFKDADIRPANIIMDVDKDMNVIGRDGAVGFDIEEAYSKYLKGKIVPVINIDNQEKKDAFISYYPIALNLIDMAVISHDYSILRDIKSSISQIRAIYDIREKDISDSLTILQETNKGQALTILMSGKQIDRKTIEFFQYRLKTVWIDIEGENRAVCFAAITSGAFGVISDDVEITFSYFDSLIRDEFNNITTRTPANVAHRGLCLSNYENSLEGFIDAYELGATHFELDLQMSRDGHLVVMHDDTIDRTTNGSGRISNMTTAQLSQYKITKNYQGKVLGDGVAIPLLEDVFAEFVDKDIIIVVEIKTGHAQAVPVLKDLLDSFDMYGKVVVISFDRNQLRNMKNLIPEIPIADLNTHKVSTFASSLVIIGSYACGINTQEANCSSQFVKMCVARGIAPWGWTFGYGSQIMNGWNRGIIG